MESNSAFRDVCDECESYLADELPDLAYETMLDAIGGDARPRSAAEWADALQLVSRSVQEFGGADYLARLDAAAAAPENAEALYALAHRWVDERKFDTAASLLAWAFECSPRSPLLLSELVSALEMARRSSEAIELLARVRQTAPRWEIGPTSSFASAEQWQSMFRYLDAFNRLLVGDLDGIRTIVAEGTDRFDPSRDPRLGAMWSRLARLLARHDALAATGPIARDDLRRWHYVMSASVLLELAPEDCGVDEDGQRFVREGHHGRFLRFEDSFAAVAGALERALLVTERIGRQPAALFHFDTPSSRVVAMALGRRLGLESRVAWSGSEAGLVVAYDPLELIAELIAQFAVRGSAEQTVFARSLSAEHDCAAAPDLVGSLVGRRYAPWERHTIWDSNRPQLAQSVVELSESALADAIVQAGEAGSGAASDVRSGAGAVSRSTDSVDSLLAFVDEVAAHDPAWGLALLRDEGTRERHFSGSPVPAQ